MTRLCIGPSNSSGKEIPSYKCGQMHECGLCFPQNNGKVFLIEHLSKWLELVPLLDYSSEGITYAFFG